MLSNFLAISSLLALLTATPSTKPNLDFREKIEARVGQEIITSTDIAMAKQAIKAARPDLSDAGAEKIAFDKKITEKLIPEFLKQYGASITNAEVEQRVNALPSMNNLTNEQFRAALAQQGMTYDQLGTQFRLGMEQERFNQIMRRQIEDRLPKLGDKKGEEELLAYFKSHSDKFSRNAEVQLQECIIPLGDDPKAAEQKAKDFQKKPANFYEGCVKKVSTAPSAKESKGILGNFKRGSFREDIDAKIFSMKKNEIAIIPMGNAFQLFKVTQMKDLGPQKFDEIKDKVREEVAKELLQKEIDSTLAELKSRVYIKI